MQLKRLHFPRLDSTNTWVKEHADELDPNALTLVTADEQTAGRGRFSRSWVSPAGMNIYATYCFFRSALWAEVGHAPQVLALSATDVLENLGLVPKLKWPNDILLSEKKMGGILCETSVSKNGFAIIIGIGLNINMPPELLSTIDRPATSLLVELGQEHDPAPILDSLSQRFILHLTRFLKEGFEPFLPWFRAMASPSDPDGLVHFHDGRRIWTGRFEGIADDGGFLLMTPEGTLRHFHAGEILLGSAAV